MPSQKLEMHHWKHFSGPIYWNYGYLPQTWEAVSGNFGDEMTVEFHEVVSKDLPIWVPETCKDFSIFWVKIFGVSLSALTVDSMGAVANDLSAAVMACVAIILGSHCYYYGHEMICFFRGMFSEKSGDESSESESNARLDEALWQLRINQHVSGARAFLHVTVISVFALQVHALLRPSFLASLRIALAVSAWILHHIVVSGLFPINKKRVQMLNLCFHTVATIFLYTLPGDCEDGLVMSSLASATRFCMAVMFADVRTTLPGQSMMSLVKIWNEWQHDPGRVTLSVANELLLLSAVLSISGLVEVSTRRRLAMLLNSESMVMSFRQMLRGLCDGEVLLNSKLCIVGGCLKTLLMTSEEFSSQSFEELLVEEERPTFRHFMLDSAKEAPTGSAPTCVRVSLKRAGHRIGVDLFHVKMPHLLGEETFHLIALREDFDSKAALEVFNEANENANPILEIDEKSKRPPSCRSDNSVPPVTANSMIQLCQELQEMTLLVDANTPLLDVDQAHLSFLRQSDEADSSMLSLRRLVRPTDWGTVSKQLREFAMLADSEGQSSTHRDVLKTKLRMQDDAKRCIEADMEVSNFSPPQSNGSVRKLCLQIGGMNTVKAKARHLCQLQGVNEGSGESDNVSTESQESCVKVLGAHGQAGVQAR